MANRHEEAEPDEEMGSEPPGQKVVTIREVALRAERVPGYARCRSNARVAGRTQPA